MADATVGAGPSQDWSAEGYAHHAGFVPVLGAEILGWLDPHQNERILDLGCGDGALSVQIAESGARVLGLDASADMVAAARGRGIDAVVGSGERLSFEAEFDAVFSNAALHWMTDADAVASGVARALKPGGRFVAEFGGHLNIASIAAALQAALGKFGGDSRQAFPWYFPTEAEYGAVLARAGLTLKRSAIVPRQTPLPTDMAGWLETFARGYLDGFAGARRGEVRDYLVRLLERPLRDSSGKWTADYVRLRIEARK